MDANDLLENENIEIQLLIDALRLKYGFDYTNYTRSHIKRRVLHRIKQDGLRNVSELIERILYDKNVFDQLIVDLSINVTEMFRFPKFFRDIRIHVVPILKTYPHINVWHAGCSSGEEVISMAILLKEEGLLDKAQIYATDINKKVLEIANAGIYPIDDVKKWTKNYQEAGGKKSFSEYYTAKYNSVIFNNDLYKNITFQVHNLVQDKQFISANLIVCRNVMIYFNKVLKENVFELFRESLVPGGVLGIGSKESLKFTSVSSNFQDISSQSKIYIKKVEWENE